MRTPDFFIIGAPKCGTTALYTYLRSHPQVFMPEIKEPRYFSPDVPGRRVVDNDQDYAALFVGAPRGAMVGEASPSYLRSELAAREIIRRNPGVRMIAMLRNPIEMAHSLHAHRVYSLEEDIVNFERAWALQDERKMGRCLPRHCRDPRLLLYREICSLGKQIRRVMEHVPKSQILICIFEEFIAEPRESYERVLEFLGLAMDGRAEFPRVNANRVWRSRGLAGVCRSARVGLGSRYGVLKAASSAFGLEPGRILHRINVVKKGRASLERRVRRQLADEFSAEVGELEQLLHRRLDCWTDFRSSDARA